MQSETRGVLAIILDTLFFAGSAVTARLAAQSFSGAYISFVRFLIGVALTLSFMRLLKKGWPLNNPKPLLLRGFFGALAMTFFYLSIQHTSAGRASLLANTYPVFVAITGAVLFKQPFALKHIFSLTAGVAGVFFILFDHTHYGILGHIYGLLSAVASGFAVHYIKEARLHHDVFSIYLSACVFGLAICFFSIPETAHLRMDRSLLWILGVALLAFGGQVVMAYGFSFISAAKGSLFGLLEVPFTLLLSALVTGEEMGWRFLMGAVLIMAGLILTAAPVSGELKKTRNIS